MVFAIAAGSGVLLFRANHFAAMIKVAPGQPGAEPAHIRGGAGARVTLEEFGDYQCNPCGILAGTLLKVEHAYGDQLRIVFRQFPLAMHEHAMNAACAAEAAGLQGRFWEMHDLLFQNARSWGKESPKPTRRVTSFVERSAEDEAANQVRETFIGFAAQLGMDVERFKRDLDSKEVRQRIEADRGRGASIGVDRTPVVLINGVQIPFASLKVEPLHKLIDDALAGKPLVPEPDSSTPSPSQTPSTEQ